MNQSISLNIMDKMKSYTFIIFEENGYRHQWTCKAYDEDSAYDKAYDEFPNAEYIELF